MKTSHCLLNFQRVLVLTVIGYCFAISPATWVAIVVTNGDFETPNVGGSQVQDIPNWFDGSANFQNWVNPAGSNENGTQVAAFRGDGYIYQSLGTYDASAGSALNWSFDQSRFTDANASTGFSISFFAGNTVAAADGSDITGLGLTQVGSARTFTSLNSQSLTTRTNSGVTGLAGVADGTELWLRIGGTGTTGQFGPVDNISANVSVAAPLMVTNGDFESPNVGNSQVQNIPSWFDGTANFQDWVNPAGSNQNGTQVAAMRGDGFAYQSLGIYESGNGTQLEWSFEQSLFNDGNGSTGFDLTFLAGSPSNPADGADILGQGLTEIDTFSFTSLNSESLTERINSGVLDLTGIADGTEIFLRIGGNGTTGQFAPVDNLSVTQVALPIPEPASVALWMLLGLGLVQVRNRLARR